MKPNQIVFKALGMEATYKIKEFNMSEYESVQFSLQNHLGNTNRYKLTKIYGENGMKYIIHILRKNQFGETFQAMVKVSSDTNELMLIDNTIINGKFPWWFSEK